jgi:hypothetical protein
MKKIATNIILFLTVFVAACETTKPVAEWRSKNYQGGAFDNILIIGVSKETTVRRLFEDTFVTELKKLKVNAVSSTTIMPAGDEISKQNVDAAIKGKNIDAVLVTHLVGVESKEVYTPPTYTPSLYAGYYGYYSHVHSYVYQPGYYTRYKVVKLETNLYDVASGKVVWSTQSETVDPSKVEKLIQSKIKTTIGQLKKQKLI